MPRLIVALALVALFTSSLSAQVPYPKGSGYVFIAPGAISGGETTATLHFGGGGDVLLYEGLAAGAEVGYLAPIRAPGDGFGILSANLSYYFARRQRRLVPFVTGGYSLAFRSGTANGGNFGGGVEYWFRDHVGVRFEFRDHLFSSDSPHFYGFRFGVAFH